MPGAASPPLHILSERHPTYEYREVSGVNDSPLVSRLQLKLAQHVAKKQPSNKTVTRKAYSRAELPPSPVSFMSSSSIASGHTQNAQSRPRKRRSATPGHSSAQGSTYERHIKAVSSSAAWIEPDFSRARRHHPNGNQCPVSLEPFVRTSPYRPPSGGDFPAKPYYRSPKPGSNLLSELNYYDSECSMDPITSRSPNFTPTDVLATAAASSVSKGKKTRRIPAPLRLPEPPRAVEASSRQSDDYTPVQAEKHIAISSASTLIPDTPAFHQPSEREQRRRRLMKVGKIFGETVPVDLVIPPKQADGLVPVNYVGIKPDSAGYTSGLRSSLSLPNFTLPSMTATLLPKKTVESPYATLSAQPAEIPKKRILRRATHSGPHSNVENNHSSARPWNSGQPVIKLVVTSEESQWISSDEDVISNQLASGEQELEEANTPTPVRPDMPFLNISGMRLGALDGDGRYGVSRRERRQGWSGEWNQGNMKEVIVKLRELR